MLKRYSGVALALAMLLLLLTACSDGVGPIKGDKKDLNIVANVFGQPVYLEEVNYLVYNYKLEMEGIYGEGIWDTPESSEKYRGELLEKVEAAMIDNPTFVSICREYDIELDDKDTEDYVKDYINDFAEQLGGKDEYKKQLAENGMTDHHLRYLLSIESSREELRQALCKDGSIDDSDETARAAIEGDEFIRTLHVLIRNDVGDDIEENRKLAEKVVSQLDEGEPLTRMIGRYSEDVFMTTTDGYYFTRGEYEKAYEDAAFALAENEYSGVIEGDSGFYIIMRLPKEADYIEKNFESLKDRYLFVMFENIICERAAEAEIEYTDYGKTLDILNLG